MAKPHQSKTTSSLSRRRFLHQAGTLAGLAAAANPASGERLGAAPPDPGLTPGLRDRIEGLLLGSFLGDALGGPIEFQDPDRIQQLANPPKAWGSHERLDADALEAAAGRLHLRAYGELRPNPEPYAHWTSNAPPGTVTDDSRHKLILLEALGQAESAGAWPFDVQTLARAFLVWPDRTEVRSRRGYDELARDWLHEWQLAARWILGGRDLANCRPPERMWNGLPTCCGQMTLPPLAALFPGRPVEAYQAAFQLAFFDNGWGRDLNAALVAALATALVCPPVPEGTAPRSHAWQPVLASLRETDPYGYREVPWTERSVNRWLDLAQTLAIQADQRPARLFQALEHEFRQTIKWEAQVPFVVTFAVLALTDYHPLAALQLSLEWGHDTDSYAQLLGAFIGARHGIRAFPPPLVATVRQRLPLDYGEATDAGIGLLERLSRRNATTDLFS